MLAFPSHLSSLGFRAIPLPLAIAVPLHRVNKREVHVPPELNGAGTIIWRPSNPSEGFEGLQLMVPANGPSTVVGQGLKSCIWAGSGLAPRSGPVVFALQNSHRCGLFSATN